jgi:hypothetical protein
MQLVVIWDDASAEPEKSDFGHHKDRARHLIKESLGIARAIAAGEDVKNLPEVPDFLGPITVLFRMACVSVTDQSAMERFVNEGEAEDLGGWMDWFQADRVILDYRLRQTCALMLEEYKAGIAPTIRISHIGFLSIPYTQYDVLCSLEKGADKKQVLLEVAGGDADLCDRVYKAYAMASIKAKLGPVDVTLAGAKLYPAFGDGEVQYIMNDTGLTGIEVWEAIVPRVEEVSVAPRLLSGPRVS